VKTGIIDNVKRVTWPSRKEVYATTVVVILTSIFFGVYLFGLDAIFATAVTWLFRRMGGAV
jgi:preprotein translocase subunit SecE